MNRTPRLLRAALALVCLLGLGSLLSPAARAQTTTIGASTLKIGGYPITSGSIYITAVGTFGQPIVYADATGAQNGPSSIACKVLNGAITGAITETGSVSGACVVADACQATPANLLYSIQVVDQSSGLRTSGVSYTLNSVAGVCGSTWALDHYAPPGNYPSTQQVQASQGTAVPSSCIAPAQFTLLPGGAFYNCVGGVYSLVTGSGGGATAFSGLTGVATAAQLPAATSSAQGAVQLPAGAASNVLGTAAATAATAYDVAGAAYNQNVIYAGAGNSKLGVAACALNTNISTGGGTADDSCLQADLDALGTAGGGTLYLNGYALLTCSKYGTTNSVDGNVQTSALQTHSNIKIDATGGGVFLQASSNCAMLGNNIQGNPAATFQTQMSVTGGVWNDNGANQNKCEQAQCTLDFFTVSFWFSGFNGLDISNLTIRNAVTYGIIIANGTSFVSRNYNMLEDTQLGSGVFNQDSLHMWGTLSGISVSNLTATNTDDDVIAFNTDEGVQNRAGKVAVGGNYLFRYPLSGGAISNVLIDGVTMINTEHQVRFIGYVTTGGVATVTNITLRNFTGAPLSSAMAESGITSSSNLAIDDWQLTGANNGINLPVTTGLSIINANPTAALNYTGSSLYTIVAPSDLHIAGGNAYDNGLSVLTTSNNTVWDWLVYGSHAFPTAGSGPLCSYNAVIVGGCISAGGYQMGSAQTFSWSAAGHLTVVAADAIATQLSSPSAGVIEADTSKAGDDLGTFKGAAFIGGTFTPSAARKGTFVCTVGGTITIANANELGTSDVIISLNTAGGTISTAPAMKTVTSGTGFTVLCGSADTSTYNYDILN